MKTTIITGKHVIVETNVFYLDDPHSEVLIHFVMNEEEMGDIWLKFTEKEDEDSSISCEMINNELVMTFCNFNSSFGAGTTKPIEIGAMEGKKLSIHVWSFLFNKKVRKVEYSIFREL